VVAVNAIIVNDSRILLTKRRDTGEWCLPGGLVEFGESVVQALIREVHEEIGVTCEAKRLIGIYSANNVQVKLPARRNSIILAFECVIRKGKLRTSVEVSEFRFFDTNHLPELMEYQVTRIRDALRRDSHPVLQ
jgi:8-oxo-dGTP pyrophosphatase MutT (NUDIX family)